MTVQVRRSLMAAITISSPPPGPVDLEVEFLGTDPSMFAIE
jgi:hypothetical protein